MVSSGSQWFPVISVVAVFDCVTIKQEYLKKTLKFEFSVFQCLRSDLPLARNANICLRKSFYLKLNTIKNTVTFEVGR